MEQKPQMPPNATQPRRPLPLPLPHLELLLEVSDNHVAKAVAREAARRDVVQPLRVEVGLEHQGEVPHGGILAGLQRGGRGEEGGRL